MPAVPSGFFPPLDEELGLLAGSLTPQLQGQATHLGSWLPFGKVAGVLTDLLGVQLSEPTVRRCTETHGAAYEQVQAAAVAVLEATAPEPPGGPALQLCNVDGAMVPLVGGVWAEVKTLVLGKIVVTETPAGEPVGHSMALSYFSRLTDATTFQRLSLVETQRRGVETAGRVIAPTDGAVWIQDFLDYHRPDAVRVLDFGHAATYVATIGRAGGPPESAAFATWLQDSLHTLKHEGGTALFPELRAQIAAHPEQAELAAALAYLEKRTAMLQYPDFQAHGWPIGSGSVESANKLVVEARLKGAGMHWAPAQVNPLLSLRNAVCSERWPEAWGEIQHYHHQQRLQRRRKPRPRGPELPPAVAPNRTAPPAPPPILPQPAPQSPSLPAETKPPYRPADNHPWKRHPSCTPSRRTAAAKL